jgi:hypothetical protein
MPANTKRITMCRNFISLLILVVTVYGCTFDGKAKGSSLPREGEEGMPASHDSMSAFEDRFSDINATPRQTTELGMRVLVKWIDHFRQSKGRIPSAIEEIVHPDPRDPNFQPSERWWSDGWQRRFRYTPKAGSYELRSAGEDGVFGTSDDLVVTGP